MLALESLQIPQTVGPTFLLALERWYGADAVARHTPAFASPVRMSTMVMHGHFPAGTYRTYQRVCWVRDPARRLVALYIQMRHQPSAQVGMPDSDLQQRMASGAMSFDEFIHHTHVINSLSRWFNGLTIEDFDFVGISEDVERELTRCAQILRVPDVQLEISDDLALAPEFAALEEAMHEETLQYVRDLNPACTELYLRAREVAERSWLEQAGIQVAAPRVAQLPAVDYVAS